LGTHGRILFAASFGELAGLPTESQIHGLWGQSQYQEIRGDNWPKTMSTSKAKTPKWNIPENLQALIDADSSDGDGIWEDDSWDPILLTVMAGTSYGGRDIPFSWQIEFQPSDVRLEEANKAIEARGIESDGYGWAKLIEDVFVRDHPELADELHFGDTEIDTCVVWVESESTCKTLIEVTWSLMQVS
jgi:hypothetical protein